MDKDKREEVEDLLVGSFSKTSDKELVEKLADTILKELKQNSISVENTKSWWKSKTIQVGIAATLSGLALFINSGDATELIISAVGLTMTVLRFVSTSKLVK